MKKLFLFILIISTIIVAVWFKDGYILGYAEDGIIFYHISNYFHQSQYTWMEYPGLGSPSLNLVASKPTLGILSYLQSVGLQGFLIQAGVLWFLLVSSGIGICLLVRELFPTLPNKYILLSVLFYWFNPISMVDVWNRFLLNYIFFFAILPIGSYFYIKGLKNGRYRWILIFNILLIFYSYAFSYVAFSILFWIWLILVTFFYILFNKDWRIRIFSIKYFLLTLVLFSLVNSWWVLPIVKVNISGGSNPTADLFAKQNNLSILEALSKSIGNLKDIFKLTNISFLSSDSLNWVKIYYSPILYIIGYALVAAVLLFIIKKKNKGAFLLGSLFLISIFLSKGNSPPFGEIYSFIFNNILIFQVFRNPFEKFGFILALSTGMIIGASIYELTYQNKGGIKQFIFPFYFIAIFFYLGFPLYSGLVLTNKFPPTNNYSIGFKVKVPNYYKEADDWLVSRGNNFRYIGFPIKYEGITYNWEKGYAGVELPVALFSTPGIIHTTTVPYFYSISP